MSATTRTDRAAAIAAQIIAQISADTQITDLDAILIEGIIWELYERVGLPDDPAFSAQNARRVGYGLGAEYSDEGGTEHEEAIIGHATSLYIAA